MKKKSCFKPNVFIAEHYSHQNEILKSKTLSLKEDVHKRENNDRVSLRKCNI